MKLLLSYYLILTWNLNRSIFLYNHFHFCRYLDCFWFLNHLVDWNLTILCIDNRLFDMIICLNSYLFDNLNGIIVPESDTSLIMDYFSLDDRNYLCSFLFDYIFFWNSYDIINYFFYIFWHLNYLRYRSKHFDNRVNFYIIQINCLRSNHS